MRHRDPTSQDPVRDALRALPRVRATDDFATRLQTRLRREAVVRRRRRVGMRLAAAAALLAIVGGGVHLRQRLEAAEAHRQRQALVQEHQQLQRDLDALRRRVADSPTLYLGSAPDYDVVIDLGPWMEPPTAVQPAAYVPPRP